MDLPPTAIWLMSIAACIIPCSVFLWIWIIVRIQQDKPLLEYEPRRPVTWGLVDLLPILFGIVGMLILLSAFSNNIEEKVRTPGPADFFITGLAELFIVVLIIAWLALRSGARIPDLGLSLQNAPGNIFIGAAAFAILAPPILVIQALLSLLVKYKHSLIDSLSENFGLELMLATGFTAVIVAPICEEFFFRCFLQGWLENFFNPALTMNEKIFGVRKSQDDETTLLNDPETEQPVDPFFSRPSLDNESNPFRSPLAPTDEPTALTPPQIGPQVLSPWPIIISAILFSSMHLGQGAAPVPLFLLALGLGYLYRQTHRLLPCIVLHAILNGFSMITLFFELAHRSKEAAGG